LIVLVLIHLILCQGGCDTNHGKLIIRDSWVNLVPGAVIFKGDELVMDGCTLTHYGSDAEVMRINARYASFTNTKLDDFPEIKSSSDRGYMSIQGYNRNGINVSDNNTYFINQDSNELLIPYVAAKNNGAVVSANYAPTVRLKFEEGEYRENGYVRRFYPSMPTGITTVGTTLVEKVDMYANDEWRWRQFGVGDQIVGKHFQPGTLIKEYDFENKTITISKPAQQSGMTKINGVRYEII